MALGRSADRPKVPALCPLHDQPQRTSGEDPAHPNISAEHPQQLELPPVITKQHPFGLTLNIELTLHQHLNNQFCFVYHLTHHLTSVFISPQQSLCILCVELTPDQSKAETSLNCGSAKPEMWPNHLRDTSTDTHCVRLATVI